MIRLICLILFFVVSVIADAQNYVVSGDLLGDIHTQNGNSLARLSNVFLGFLAVADVKVENALIDEESATSDDSENDKATRRNRARRRKDNRLRRTNNRRSNRSSNPNDDQNDNKTKTLRRRKGRRTREQDDKE